MTLQSFVTLEADTQGTSIFVLNSIFLDILLLFFVKMLVDVVWCHDDAWPSLTFGNRTIIWT